MNPALRRYVAWNILAWFVFLLFAIIALFAVRELGQTLQVRTEAHTYLTQAQQSLASNDWRAASQTLRRAIHTDPRIAADVVSEMGDRLVGLPQITGLLDRQLTRAAQTDPTGPTLLALGRLQLMQGRFDEAEQTLQRASEMKAELSLLILGQLALKKGDFGAAQHAFSRYWAKHEEERDRQLTALMPRTPNPDSAAAAAETLFRLGLWDKAAQVGQTVSADKYPQERDFFAGLKAEQEGDKKAALAQYRQAVEGPNPYLLALARIRFLDAGGAMLSTVH